MIRVLLFAVCSCICLAAGEPQKRALVVGNANYTHLPQIPCPRGNAHAIASALHEVGFAVSERYDLTDRDFQREFRSFIAGVNSGDIVFFYFSGYSLQSDEVNWLLPVDFDPDDSTLVSQRAYALRLVLSEIHAKHPNSTLIVVDASRRNPKLQPEGLAAMPDVQGGTLISYSAAVNESAPDDPPGQQADLYTSMLINAIRKPGSTPLSAFNDAQTAVVTTSGGRQQPFVYPVTVPSFYFVPPPAAPAPRPIVVTERQTVKENPKDFLSYVWIQPGTFLMGCVKSDRKCAADERPQHEVKISKGFWMTSTEVTVAAYERFTTATGHRTPPKTKTNPKWLGTDLPVTMVNWQDATAYCAWIGGRLPTEAEWEYAARGGKQDEIYPWGNAFDPTAANSYKTNRKLKGGRDETAPVRKLGAPNAFNLWDMVGNVREWTQDAYDPSAYEHPSPVDPLVESGSSQRVIRGGSFNGGADDLRISCRDHTDPVKEVSNQTGFRCVVPDWNYDKTNSDQN